MRSELSAVSGAVTSPLLQYIHAEQAAGIMLVMGGVIGLIWANTAWADYYHQLLQLPVTILFIRESVHHWINDGLMALFFLLIGLEVKREVTIGELNSLRKASLPVLAAAGGMALPAGFFLLLNLGEPTARGWGVPVATDIAFALGVLSLLGKRAPQSLKVFLLAFATADDLGGVLIIATVYTEHLAWWALAAAGGIVAVIIVLRVLHVTHGGMYGILGVALWLAVFESGVHATIAGVIFGLLSPIRRYYDHHRYAGRAQEELGAMRAAVEREDENAVESLLGQIEELTRNTERKSERLERLLRPWVSYLVLPLFAIANAGVALSWDGIKSASASPVAQGILAGLVAGKLLGIGGAAWLTVRLGIGELPRQINWRHIVGASLLAGIGFTVSLFISQLAFAKEGALHEAKLGILVASAVAATAGAAWLLLATRPAPPPE